MNQSISGLGYRLGVDVLDVVTASYDEEQRRLAVTQPTSFANISYGDDLRHSMDLYRSEPLSLSPIFVFVHGGGFLKGDKGGADAWPDANVGRMAAQAGFLGVVINYRLAPDHVWPAGAEDVASVVACLKDNAAQYGGDPNRIVLMGTSAGAVHVAGYLKLAGDRDARTAILLSGLFGYTPLNQRDTLYYSDPALYPGRMPLEAVASTRLPLLIACAEFDPPRFQAEFLGLMQDRLARHSAMARSYIHSRHNHYSMAMHLGTSDSPVAYEICDFVHKVTIKNSEQDPYHNA